MLAGRLQRIEVKLVKAAYAMETDKKCPLAVSLLQLAIKAVASYRALLVLRKAKLYQEAESAQRTFVESWLYLMDFTWSPNEGVLEWWQNPNRPLNEKKFQLKQRVQREFAKKLKLKPRQRPSLTKAFDDLSNTSVHPTREAVESAWRRAAERCKLQYGGADALQIADLRKMVHAMDNFRIVLYLAWFIRFLRKYLFRMEPISDYFPKQSLFEKCLECWSDRAPDHLQMLFDQLQMQYAHEKRLERTSDGSV